MVFEGGLNGDWAGSSWTLREVRLGVWVFGFGMDWLGFEAAGNAGHHLSAPQRHSKLLPAEHGTHPPTHLQITLIPCCFCIGLQWCALVCSGVPWFSLHPSHWFQLGTYPCAVGLVK